MEFWGITKTIISRRFINGKFDKCHPHKYMTFDESSISLISYCGKNIIYINRPNLFMCVYDGQINKINIDIDVKFYCSIYNVICYRYRTDRNPPIKMYKIKIDDIDINKPLSKQKKTYVIRNIWGGGMYWAVKFFIKTGILLGRNFENVALNIYKKNTYKSRT